MTITINSVRPSQTSTKNGPSMLINSIFVLFVNLHHDSIWHTTTATHHFLAYNTHFCINHCEHLLTDTMSIRTTDR